MKVRSSPVRKLTSLELLKEDTSISLFDITAANISKDSAIRNAYEVLAKANADALRTITSQQNRLLKMKKEREMHKKDVEMYKTKVNEMQERLNNIKTALDKVEYESRRKDKMIQELRGNLKKNSKKKKKKVQMDDVEISKPFYEEEPFPSSPAPPPSDEIELTRRMNIRLVNELAEMKRKYELLESQVKTNKEPSTKPQTEVVENVTMAEVIRLKKKLKNEVDTRKLLQQQLEETERLRERNERLQTFLNKEKDANKRYSAQLSNQEKEIERLQEELKTTIERYKDRDMNLEQEASSLKKLVVNNSAKTQDMEKKVAVYEKVHEDYKKQISEHASQRQSLLKLIEEEKTMLKRVTLRVTSLEKEKTDLEERLAQQQQTIDRLKANDQTKELENVRNTLTEKETAIIRMETENRSLKEKVAAMSNKPINEIPKEIVPSHIQEIADLKTRIQELTIQMSQMEQHERQTSYELTQKWHEAEKRCTVLSEANGLLMKRLNTYEEKERKQEASS